MDITKIRLVISQPTTSKRPSEWECSVEALGRTQAFISERAFHAMQVWKVEKPAAYVHHQRPGEKQCAYCKAKVDCQKYAQVVGETVFSNEKALAGFDTVTNDPADQPATYMPIDPGLLAGHYLRVPLIRAWCDAIEKEVFAKMKSGELTDRHGLKAVPGKKGKRAWTDEKAVEEMFKSMKLRQDEMYDFKLISPTTAEKVLAENPRKWVKAQKFITQGQGGPSIVHVSDPRPAISLAPSADGFEVVVETPPAETPSPGPVEPQVADSGADDLV